MHNLDHLTLLSKAHGNLDMARLHAKWAKNESHPEAAMIHDYYYNEHMAHAIFYLTHARILRLKGENNHGYQF